MIDFCFDFNDVEVMENCEAMLVANGFQTANWKRFLKDFPSADDYRKRVDDFLSWYGEFCDKNTLEEGLIDYFDWLLDMVNEDGSRRYCGSSLRSFYSMVKRFWQLCKCVNLDNVVPIIGLNISKVEKCQVIERANVFTKEDLIKLHGFDNTPATLLYKVYSTIAIDCAGEYLYLFFFIIIICFSFCR